MYKNFPESLDQCKAAMGNLAKEIPQTMEGFTGLHQGSVSEGALNVKTKELIALGIAITVRCDGCIAFHVHDALEAGASRAEITEAIGVAILMGGGPSVIYGCEAFEALKQFEAVPA